MKKLPPKKPYPIEKYLQRIKDFHAEFGRAPHSGECKGTSTTYNRLVKHYGSWQKAVEAAIGVTPKYRMIPDSEVKQLLVTMHKEKNRLPHIDDFSKGQNKLINTRFGSVTCANELIFNDSVRLRTLDALQELTPAGVENATTQEICSLMNKKGFAIAIYSVSRLLDASRKENFVVSGRYDKAMWWSLTNAGIQFINSFNKGKKDGSKIK
ncbi:MAG: hypothetical protein Q8L88_02405 [Bacteroidota bacterium]|nr:hypothetical protein [Bacteroidota bacterium]